MEKISIKSYAIKHKLSIFNVVKMAKTGQISTETIMENAKEVTYVLFDEKVEENTEKTIMTNKTKEPYGLKKENEKLRKEIQELKKEIVHLQKKIV